MMIREMRRNRIPRSKVTKTLSILGPALLKTPPPPSGDIIKIKKKLTIKAGIANLIQVKKTSLRKKERKKERKLESRPEKGEHLFLLWSVNYTFDLKKQHQL